MTQFTVPGVRGKARPRFTRQGVVYTPAETRTYEQAVRLAYAAAGGRMHDGPVALLLTVYQALPKRATKAQRAAAERGEIHPISKPDLDNVLKIVLDALNGAAYADDRQVVRLDARKLYTPGESRICVAFGDYDTMPTAEAVWAERMDTHENPEGCKPRDAGQVL